MEVNGLLNSFNFQNGYMNIQAKQMAWEIPSVFAENRLTNCFILSYYLFSPRQGLNI